MLESRSNWTDLIRGVGLEIADVFNQAQEEYQPGIFNVLIRSTGEGAEQNFTGKTGVGEIEEFSDGDTLPGGRRHKTYTTKVIYNNYGKFLDVTKNQIEDRDFDEALDEMGDLSRGANFSQDKSGMQLFNGGFATTRKVNGYKMTWYGDDVPLFSTKHPTPVPGESSQSNASSNSIALTDDNLETASISLTLQQTDDGQPISTLGKESLVLPRNLKKTGQVITESERVSGNANNDINVYNGTTDMRVSKFLDNTNGGSDTAWYLIIPQRSKLYHETRQQPRLEMDKNIKNKVVTFTVDARWANYVKDWRRTWGSKGDDSSYSS